MKLIKGQTIEDLTVVIEDTDLIGQLEGFPKEVVAAMIDQQLIAGNQPDVTVFQRNVVADTNLGGFNWGATELGEDGWADIIINKNFEGYDFLPYDHHGSKNIMWVRKKK